MASSRLRGDVGSNFNSRRHASHLSISDPSHHVTDVIGTLYGDEDDNDFDGDRPMSFIGGGQYQDQIHRSPAIVFPDQEQRRPLARTTSDQTHLTSSIETGSPKNGQTLPLRSNSQRNRANTEHSPHSPLSPTLSLRDVQADPSNAQFPLTNIDNPSDIAQELSNLQALRRLSMDVGNSIDPDIPPMAISAMPAIAPRGDDDENDPSRLLWVPARVHPELAPTEFKSFLENRVQSIRRRSGDSFHSATEDENSASPGSLSPGSASSGSLSRRKSKLSRQIDNSGGRGAEGYIDGAERLERQKSRGIRHQREVSIDELVSDPSKVVQQLAQESQTPSDRADGAPPEDMPILPVAPPGQGLRRSTRTTYRKGGSLRTGNNLSSRRLPNRNQDGDSSEPSLPQAPPGHGLSRVQSEPISENFSRPSRSIRRQGNFAQESPAVLSSSDTEQSPPTSPPQVHQDQLSVRGKPSREQEPAFAPTSPPPEGAGSDSFSQSYPQRSGSQESPTSAGNSHQDVIIEEPPARSSRRPAGVPLVNHATSPQPPQPSPQQQYTSKTPSAPPSHTVNETLGANPSPYPGSGGMRTDALTFIPTLTPEDKKADKKSKRDKDDDSASTSSGKSGSAWKWFKGGSEDKERKKEDAKKSKAKALVEKAQDNVRLDVIQNSIEKTSPKGRESLVLDRDTLEPKLQEERKKEGNRRSDSKKEKDGSIFSSIFGGSKKKEEKEKQGKKNQQYLAVPDDPPYKPLQPDVDYHWSRFPLLEERAIYRMAHIKLANPRRPLHSQVLLSNFMYSYLAIVQAMHPQMNVPTSPQQKRLEEEARRKRQEEEYLAQQMQMQEEEDSQQDLDQYNFDYHRAAVQYADSHGQVDYVDDAQIYEDEHGNDHRDRDHRDQHNHHDHYDQRDQYDQYDQHGHDGYGYEGHEGYGQGAKEYYQYHDNRRNDGRDDMW